MLVGVAALSAWGLCQFNQILASKPPARRLADRKIAGEATRYWEAFAEQYGEMFWITMVICAWSARSSGCSSPAGTPAEPADVIYPGLG